MKLHEKGYALIELLIAITIMILASGAAGAGIYQIVRNTDRNNQHMTAVLQLQNAGYRISRDAYMAQSLTANLTLPDFLRMSWTEYTTGDQYQVIYTLEDMDEGEFKELVRNQSVNGSANITSLVAQYINPNLENTRCDFTDDVLILTITATVGKGSLVQSETRIYKVISRSG
jgi:type II secretory pathway component PulJ